MIYSVQFLRGMAAFFVFVYHVYYIFRIYSDISLPYMDFFHIGVDIFFIISGFIMVHIIGKSEKIDFKYVKSFLRSRFLRIVPAYFIATLVVYFAYVYLLGNPKGFTYIHLIKSLLFIPYESNEEVYPVLGVGWTLNYEVFYYALIVISLMIFRTRYYIGVFSIMLILLSIKYVGFTLVVPFSFWFNFIIIEFLIGMLLGFMYNSNTINSLFGIVAVTTCVTLYLISPHEYTNIFIASLIVTVAIILEKNKVMQRIYRLKLFVMLGMVSYPFYLIHQPLLSLLGKISNSIGLIGYNYSMQMIFFIGFFFSFIAAYAFGRFIDDVVNPFISRYAFGHRGG